MATTTQIRRPDRTTLLALACATGLLACKNGETPANDAKSGEALQAAEKVVADAVDKAGAEAGAAALFDAEDKSIRKRACEFLTPEMVAKNLDVPADGLKQMKIMGCIYSWGEDGQTAEARLSMIQVHKTLEGAKRWYENATASKSEEEAAADLDQVKKKLDDRKELDTKLEKKTANSMADMMKMATPKGGIKFEDVPGVGDQARQSNSDGGLWIRLGNLTFNLAAYKGPEKPKLEFDPKDLKGIAKKSIESQNAWIADTLEQRRADALKLAPAVLKAIEGA